MNTALFGTDGIRGAVGEGLFTHERIARIGRALGAWIFQTHGSRRPILIIRDTRVSSPAIAQTIMQTLCEYPLTLIDGGILPTGAAWHVGRILDASCAIVVSASHNPPHDNGLKIIDCSSGKLTHEAEQAIGQLYEEMAENSVSISRGSVQKMPQADRLYADALVMLFQPQMLRGVRILADCAEGAMSDCAPNILKHFGAEVIPHAASGDGARINVDCGATMPRMVMSRIAAERPTIACAFDGDGDRLALITAGENVLDGDDLLVYFADHPRYMHTQSVVGTLLANGAVEKSLQERGKRLMRVTVGDRAIAQALSSQALYGGEPSGHYLFHDRGPLSDGMISALTFFEECVRKNQWEWDPIVRFPARSIAIRYREKRDLTSGILHAIITEAESLIQPGRVVVRYSGTEALLRVFAEAPDEQQLTHVLTVLTTQLTQELQ